MSSLLESKAFISGDDEVVKDLYLTLVEEGQQHFGMTFVQNDEICIQQPSFEDLKRALLRYSKNHMEDKVSVCFRVRYVDGETNEYCHYLGGREVFEDIKSEGLFDADLEYENEQSVATWYKASFPDDELGNSIDPELTFYGFALSLGAEDVYDLLGVGDSVVRERVFAELAVRENLTYSEVYDCWLEQELHGQSGPHQWQQIPYDYEIYEIKNRKLVFRGYCCLDDVPKSIKYIVSVPVADWADTVRNREDALSYLNSLTVDAKQSVEEYESLERGEKAFRGVLKSVTPLALELISENTPDGLYIDTGTLIREKIKTKETAEEPTRQDLYKQILTFSEKKTVKSYDLVLSLEGVVKSLYSELYNCLDYFLYNVDGFDLVPEHYGIRAIVNTGSSEGIYVDVDLVAYDPVKREHQYQNIATLKTLYDDLDAYETMGRLSGILTKAGEDFLWYNIDAIEQQAQKKKDVGKER